MMELLRRFEEQVVEDEIDLLSGELEDENDTDLARRLRGVDLGISPSACSKRILPPDCMQNTLPLMLCGHYSLIPNVINFSRRSSIHPVNWPNNY
jgi:hypothetical protein